MKKNLKSALIQKIEPMLKEKGFNYYEPLSDSITFVYVKFKESEPDPKWVEQLLKGIPAPEHEQIKIYRSRWSKKITVDLDSTLKGDIVKLSSLAGLGYDYWWSIDTEEKLNKAVEEIAKLLIQYGFDWLELG